MGKCRIELADNVETIVEKLSEGNKEASDILNAAVELSPTVDPTAMYREYAPLIRCDSMGLYGNRIVRVFSQLCHNRVDYFLAVLRAVQLKIITKTQIKRALYGDNSQFNLNKILSSLNEKLPDFDLQTTRHLSLSTLQNA